MLEYGSYVKIPPGSNDAYRLAVSNNVKNK